MVIIWHCTSWPPDSNDPYWQPQFPWCWGSTIYPKCFLSSPPQSYFIPAAHVSRHLLFYFTRSLEASRVHLSMSHLRPATCASPSDYQLLIHWSLPILGQPLGCPCIMTFQSSTHSLSKDLPCPCYPLWSQFQLSIATYQPLKNWGPWTLPSTLRHCVWGSSRV